MAKLVLPALQVAWTVVSPIASFSWRRSPFFVIQATLVSVRRCILIEEYPPDFSFLGHPAGRETFLNHFYSDTKTAFLVFNRHIFRSLTAVTTGYATLLRDISDPTVINLITILAAALEVSPVIETLLRNRSLELSRDFDGLYAKAKELIDAWKARQVRD